MKIGILTSGGDAPGMNYVLSELRVLSELGHELVAVISGYQGLMDANFVPLDSFDLDEAKLHAGTIIKTSRPSQFKEKKYFKKALNNIAKNKLELLIILGGDGSLRGARELQKSGMKVLFIPATIDNDVLISDYAVGFSSAANIAADNIKKMSYSNAALSRSGIYEVMGRNCGRIAEKVKELTHADFLISEEFPLDEAKLIKEVRAAKGENLKIVVQENLIDIIKLAITLEKHSKRKFKALQIGFIQRAADPTKEEIKKAKLFASLAVQCVKEHKFNQLIAFEGEKPKLISMSEIQ